MTVTFGYTIFYVENVAATMRFFSDAFGLEQRFVTPEGDYGELETGATTLSFVSNHLADSNLAAAGGFERISAERKPVGASITLLTDDVAAVFAVALDAGAQRYVEPMVKPRGQTVAYLRDLNGILIELATPMVA